MSNEIMVYENDELGSVRTMMIDNQPWFVGKDVAQSLKYANTQKAIRDHVDNEDKLTERIVLSGQKRKMIIINESGLYSLVLSSKLETAKKFKRWITSEVLPSIRKHGMYMTGELEEKLRNSETKIEELLEKLSAEHCRCKQTEYKSAKAIEERDKVISELNSKADYCNDILLSERMMNVTMISKDYGMSATCLNHILKAYGVQYKLHKEGLWVLKAEYQHLGYTRTITMRLPGSDRYKQYTYWTEEGRKFIYDFLKEKGILPKSEQNLQ